MATDKDQLREPSSESLERGYETSDVSVKGLAWFVVCLIVVAAVVHAGVWFLLEEYIKRDELRDRPYAALADKQFADAYNNQHGTRLEAQEVPPPPPEPRLQPSQGHERTPEADLRLMRNQEDDMLRRLGWVIDPVSHMALAIPSEVMSAVIHDEAGRQKRPRMPTAAREGDASPEDPH